MSSPHDALMAELFRRYDAAAGVCLCCQALFDSLEAMARKYNLDLQKLMEDLRAAALAGQPPGP